MRALACPHCAKPALSVMRKLWLAPVKPATCRACGKRVGISYASTWAVLPFLACIAFTPLVDPVAAKIALWIVGFAAMTAVHLFCVPLKPR